MPTREQIKENRTKLEVMGEVIRQAIERHDEALRGHIVKGAHKYLSASDMADLIEEYKILKADLQAKFQDLL